MKEIYQSSPFKIRNADEYDLSSVLSLFVDPIEGLATPFEYENNIIKGRMGSGKTIYLRANHAYYLYSTVPTILDGGEPILPIFIKLSDFQHIRNPEEIYENIIIQIAEKMCGVYIHLQDAKKMSQIHEGIMALPFDMLRHQEALVALSKLTVEEYTEKIQKETGLSGKIKHPFFGFSADRRDTILTEFKARPKPGIVDIEQMYLKLLDDHDGKILLLLDEAGSLTRSFFQDSKDDSYFEILMNQLRTAQYFRTKVAIYPHSYQDVITETRYGDVKILEDSVSDEDSFKATRRKAIKLMRNYLNVNVAETSDYISTNKIFNLSNADYGDCLEQLINASGGNMRRLIQLLDASMKQAFNDHQGSGMVEKIHAIDAISRQCTEAEASIKRTDLEYLRTIAQACKKRVTFQFRFPYNASALNKYTSRSEEINLLNVPEIGTGRRGTLYAFDYSYCVAHDIPTHSIKNSERINPERSMENGEWIRKITTISDEIISQTAIASKIDGKISWISDNKDAGHIDGADGKEYFFLASYTIDSGKKEILHPLQAVRFLPIHLKDMKVAKEIEII